MKIPYVVNLNTREAYATSDIMKTSPGEAPRKVVAEDFEWDDDFTPAPLTYFAALTLSRVFHRINPLKHILQKDVDMLMDLYPADIPLKASVPHIKVCMKLLISLKIPMIFSNSTGIQYNRLKDGYKKDTYDVKENSVI